LSAFPTDVAFALIELCDVSRRLSRRDRPLLANVSLRIDASSRVGLAGPSGCGKSSLLRVMALLDPISEGRILLRGNPVSNAEVPRYRREVIYLSQHAAMIQATVRENLAFVFQLKSSASQYDETRVIAWLEQLEKGPGILDQPVDQLSGGERQLIALVRALQLDPSALLLDEPTASLDATAVARVESLLLQWQQQQPTRSFVWVSHDEAQLARVSARFIQMEQGRLIGP